MILSSRFWKTFQVGHGKGRSVEPYTPLQIIQTQRRQTLFSLNAFIIVGYVYNITWPSKPIKTLWWVILRLFYAFIRLDFYLVYIRLYENIYDRFLLKTLYFRYNVGTILKLKSEYRVWLELRAGRWLEFRARRKLEQWAWECDKSDSIITRDIH